MSRTFVRWPWLLGMVVATIAALALTPDTADAQRRGRARGRRSSVVVVAPAPRVVVVQPTRPRTVRVRPHRGRIVVRPR